MIHKEQFHYQKTDITEDARRKIKKLVKEKLKWKETLTANSTTQQEKKVSLDPVIQTLKSKGFSDGFLNSWFSVIGKSKINIGQFL